MTGNIAKYHNDVSSHIRITHSRPPIPQLDINATHLLHICAPISIKRYIYVQTPYVMDLDLSEVGRQALFK